MADDGTPQTVVVERSGGSGMGMIVLAIVLLAAVLIGAYFMMNYNANETRKTDAIEKAADKVGDSAKKVGDSAEKAADKVGD